MRQKYGSQFSILQLNSMVLILNLSLADLLCSVVGAPNILLVSAYIIIAVLYLFALHVYLRQRGFITGRFCYYVGLFTLFGCKHHVMI